jgi:Amt family ammonium transporter
MSTRTINALIVTNLAACSGGITWVVTEMILRRSTKMSLFGLCSGIVAGLVAITPACGYVTPAASFVFGSLGT